MVDTRHLRGFSSSAQRYLQVNLKTKFDFRHPVSGKLSLFIYLCSKVHVSVIAVFSLVIIVYLVESVAAIWSAAICCGSLCNGGQLQNPGVRLGNLLCMLNNYARVWCLRACACACEGKYSCVCLCVSVCVCACVRTYVRTYVRM